MAFLQFLTGGRDQQFEELNEAASLVVGSAPDAHIKLNDPGIEGKHCTVYPAQGAFWLQDMGTGQTIKDMKRLASGTEGLKPGDVFILGRTFVKFWDKKPEGAAGGGGGGADPAALEAATRERDELKAELEALKASGGESAQKLQEAEADLAANKEQLESVQAEMEQVRAQVEERGKENESLRQEKSDAEAKVQQLEADLEAARAEADAKVEEAKQQASKEREDAEAALEADRAALEALKSKVEASGHDRIEAARGPSDLGQALEALALPDPIQRRLQAAITAEVDREVVRRSAGPVVPLRGLSLPGSDRDLESELRAVKQRGEQVAKVRELGLHELESGEIERLLEMARG